MKQITCRSILTSVAVVVLASFVLVACGSSNAATPTAPSTDLVALGQLIALPDGVESAEWTTIEMPGGNDWRLLARLVVSADLARKLQNESAPLGARTLDAEGNDWFVRGVDPTLPIERNEPELFKDSPLLNGWMAIPRENVVLLSLITL